ncbi:MAG: poly-gamma-glutamate system protein [Candidatus Hydrothermia bacterium]|nr:poly-gamma-glutamate system protein [Candidatus Hydrothermia bacterium]
MKRRKGRLPAYILVFDAILGILLCFFALSSKSKVYAPYYKLKLEAARFTETMFLKVKESRLEKNIPIDPVNDPNGSGLIGMQLSPITTEFGDLTAKLTSVNPNFAALFVQYLKKLHLKGGDLVAVHFTSSFPALNIAMISAIKTLKLRPIIFTSVGSSMWGANIPQFTYLDMEDILYRSGYIDFKTSFASAGGIDDIGRGLSLEGRQLIKAAINRTHVVEIEANDLSEAIEKKFKIYLDKAGDEPIKCFINVGGNTAVLAGVEVPSGIVSFEYRDHPGLVGLFLKKGIPVVNIYNVNQLARRHGLPSAPVPIPPPGEGELFFEVRYSLLATSISLVLFLLILGFTLVFDVDYYIKKSLRRL